MTKKSEPSTRTRRSPLRRMLLILILIPVLVYAGICTIGYFVQDSIVFPRSFAGPSTVDDPRLLGSEVWWIDTASGNRVEAWWMPAGPTKFPGPRPAVIFFHGNGELIEHNLDLARLYLSVGVGVAFLEYRGYGRSGGEPSQRAILEDARALYDRVIARPEVDPARIILHGRSLGGGVAAALIDHRPPAALILESTFTSLESMTARYFLPSFLCRNPFRTDRALQSFDGPTLVMHGENDTIVPCENSRALAEIARRGTLITNDRGHNDFGADWKWYIDTVEAFLRDQGIVTPGS